MSSMGFDIPVWTWCSFIAAKNLLSTVKTRNTMSHMIFSKHFFKFTKLVSFHILGYQPKLLQTNGPKCCRLMMMMMMMMMIMIHKT